MWISIAIQVRTLASKGGPDTAQDPSSDKIKVIVEALARIVLEEGSSG